MKIISNHPHVKKNITLSSTEPEVMVASIEARNRGGTSEVFPLTKAIREGKGGHRGGS